MTVQTVTKKGLPRPQAEQDWNKWADDLIRELEAQGGSINVGQVCEFVGKLPPGWLPANGGQIKATSHPVLVRLLGGTTSANLPNLTPQYSVSNVVGIKA